jgi:voltage-gated potassium channel
MPSDGHRIARFADRLTLVRAVVAIAVVAVGLTIGAAALVRVIEPDTFGSFGDACWWALQTVSTVGYGDIVPVSGGGRAIGAALMLLGVAFVPAVTSIIVTLLVTQVRRRSGRHGDVELEVAERLERIERRLQEGGG